MLKSLREEKLLEIPLIEVYQAEPDGVDSSRVKMFSCLGV
jgi:hypothetical protein